MNEELVARYGNPAHFEDSFQNIDRSNMREDFYILDSSRGKKQDKYEVSRQKFLKLLGQHKMVWQPTNEEYDMNVEISRIYRHDRYEHLAFMKVAPRGFRSERLVPANVEIIFHLLIGRINFTYRRRTKLMTAGDWLTVASKSTYALRSLSEDQPAYLIFKIVDKEKRPGQSHKQQSAST